MRTCDFEGCTRKHVAKGLCSGHYNRANYTREQRYPKREVPCEACGTIVLRQQTRPQYRVSCSNECRYQLTYGKTKAESEAERKAHKQLVGPLPKSRSTEPPLTVVDQTKRGFVAIPCGWCGVQFLQDLRITGVAMRHCSRRCTRSHGKALRRAREVGDGGAYTLAEVLRVWLKFDKCCAYCEKPTDGLPDPDHVTPLSRGGSNSITNILPVCRLCNSHKNDMTLDEWAADRARRGMAPRTTSWCAGDPRVSHLVMSRPSRHSSINRLTA